MEKEQNDMPFIEHLEALRWTLFRSLASIFVFALIAFLNKQFVFDKVLFGPTNPDFPTFKFLCEIGEKMNLEMICIDVINYELQNIELAGQFMMHLKTSFALGFIFAFPYLVFEIWKFVKPGLKESEAKASRSIILATALLFFIGVLFGYFVLVPFGINFLSTYNVSTTIKNNFTLSNYIGFISSFVLMSGVMFELPVATYLLAKIGIVDDTLMKEHRKHATVVILFLSAVITPADIGTMILVAIPLWILYEISIKVAGVVTMNKIKAMEH